MSALHAVENPPPLAERVESILRAVRLEREECGSVRLPILAGLRSLALDLRRHHLEANAKRIEFTSWLYERLGAKD